MENLPSSLADRVVLVTGAARRIGAGIAQYLAGRGARVAIHYGTREEEARQTAKSCGGAPIFQANLERITEIEAVHRLTDEDRAVARQLDAELRALTDRIHFERQRLDRLREAAEAYRGR